MDAGGRATHNFVSAGTRFLIDERYELIKPIGHGAYGVVVSARDTATGGKVAIKKIPCVFDDAVDAKRVLREIKLLRHFRHDNIIGLLDLQSPPTNVRAFALSCPRRRCILRCATLPHPAAPRAPRSRC
jgi:hypothetical protein